jgi:hypothetical protein
MANAAVTQAAILADGDFVCMEVLLTFRFPE